MFAFHGKDQAKLVSKLLEGRVSPNRRMSWGYHYGMLFFSAIKILVPCFAFCFNLPGLIGIHKVSPLHVAVAQQNFDTVQALVNAGALLHYPVLRMTSSMYHVQLKLFHTGLFCQIFAAVHAYGKNSVAML
jgi:hypothetical protein